MRISDWSSDVCSSDLLHGVLVARSISRQNEVRRLLVATAVSQHANYANAVREVSAERQGKAMALQDRLDRGVTVLPKRVGIPACRIAAFADAWQLVLHFRKRGRKQR